MITENEAIDIVSRELQIKKDLLHVEEGPQRRWNIYPKIKEDCWHIYILNEKPVELKSSIIVFLSKITGNILYQGDANDEG